MVRIINGKEIADEFSQTIKLRVDEVKSRGVFPKLAMIRVGEDENTAIYTIKKEKLAQQIGIETVNYHFDNKVKSIDLLKLINELNIDKKIHAILLQSPLPKRLSFRNIVNAINPEKDVDGLTTLNQGRLFSGEPGIIPCAPLGVLHILRIIHEDIAGMHAVVIGRSSTVGRPLSQLLLNANCTVTLLHSYSRNLEEICKTADILVSAVGKPKFVDSNFVKKGATVIDIGLNKIKNNNGDISFVGDVDFDNVISVAGAITPVPNGIGPMTAAYLMHNTLKLACCY